MLQAGGGRPHEVAEIAAGVGVPKDHIRYILDRAFDKIAVALGLSFSEDDFPHFDV